MSHVRAENIGRPAGQAIPMQTVLQGTAKSWFNLNGTGTIAERDSFNISSYVDNGVGDYTANFATAMPNASYILQGNTCGLGTGERLMLMSFTANGPALDIYPESAPTTSTSRFAVTNTPGNGRDVARISCSVNGDPV
jgi:hypothetical protein